MLGFIHICSVSGTVPSLRHVRCVRCSVCLTHLSFAPCGLLFAFAEHSQVNRQPGHPGEFMVGPGSAEITVCTAPFQDDLDLVAADIGTRPFLWHAGVPGASLSDNVHLAWHDSSHLIVRAPAMQPAVQYSSEPSEEPVSVQQIAFVSENAG